HMYGLAWTISAALALGLPAGSKKAPTKLDVGPISSIPAQARGRIAPLDTVARQTVGEVTGRQTWQGFSAVELVLRWNFTPDGWIDEAVIKVEHDPLKQAVGLDASRRYFSLSELARCEALTELVEASERGNAAGRKPTPLQRQASEV